MRRVSYSKFSEEDLGIDTEDLLRALSDYLLQSGFDDPYMQFSEMNGHTLERLKEAIERALENGDLFDPEQAEQMRQRLQEMSASSATSLLQNLMQKLQDAGYINMDGAPPQERHRLQAARMGRRVTCSFKVTDKAIDFLGFKTLQDLLGSLGKSSFGAHDTRDLATGIDASGGAKAYEFGDTLNLDISRDALFGYAARRSFAAIESGVLGPACSSVRVSKLLRYRTDAGLQPQHDSLRRGSFYSCQEGSVGAVAPHPHAVSRRLIAGACCSMTLPKSSGSLIWHVCR